MDVDMKMICGIGNTEGGSMRMDTAARRRAEKLVVGGPIRPKGQAAR